MVEPRAPPRRPRRARAGIHVHRRLVEINLIPADGQALSNPAPSRQHHQRQAVQVSHLRFSLACTADSHHCRSSAVNKRVEAKVPRPAPSSPSSSSPEPLWRCHVLSCHCSLQTLGADSAEADMLVAAESASACIPA
jgi:hypothetical protein